MVLVTFSPMFLCLFGFMGRCVYSMPTYEQALFPSPMCGALSRQVVNRYAFGRSCEKKTAITDNLKIFIEQSNTSIAVHCIIVSPFS